MHYCQVCFEIWASREKKKKKEAFIQFSPLLISGKRHAEQFLSHHVNKTQHERVTISDPVGLLAHWSWFAPAKDTRLALHEEVWWQATMVNSVFLKVNQNLIVCLWHPETNKTFPGVLAQMCTPVCLWAAVLVWEISDFPIVLPEKISQPLLEKL